MDPGIIKKVWAISPEARIVRTSRIKPMERCAIHEVLHKLVYSGGSGVGGMGWEFAGVKIRQESEEATGCWQPTQG